MAEPALSPRQKFDAIRRKFAERMGARMDEIESAGTRLAGAPTADAVMEGLADLIMPVHRLAGSAGSFGYPVVSEMAAALECLLRAIQDRDSVPSTEESRQISALIGNLRDAAEAPPESEDPFGETMETPDTGESHDQRDPNRLIMLAGEDDADGADLSAQLGYFGYTVEIVGNAEDLWLAVEGAMPSALILDVSHPGMRTAGLAALADPRCRDVELPAIMISSDDELEPRLEAVRAGADAHFDKPVDAARLVETLNRLTGSEPVDPYRILIVDDDRPLAEFYARLLNEVGLSTHIVNDPMAVMGPLVEFRPDLILMDIHMPGCNGIELAGVIRQRDTFVQTPIVFLTAERSIDRRLLALRAGGDEFLSKPVSVELLISSVVPRAQRSRLLGSLISQDSMTGLANHSKTKEHLDTE